MRAAGKRPRRKPQGLKNGNRQSATLPKFAVYPHAPGAVKKNYSVDQLN